MNIDELSSEINDGIRLPPVVLGRTRYKVLGTCGCNQRYFHPQQQSPPGKIGSSPKFPSQPSRASAKGNGRHRCHVTSLKAHMTSRPAPIRIGRASIAQPRKSAPCGAVCPNFAHAEPAAAPHRTTKVVRLPAAAAASCCRSWLPPVGDPHAHRSTDACLRSGLLVGPVPEDPGIRE
jgi:hypothetical protein